MKPITPDEARARRNPPRPLTPDDEVFLESAYKAINTALGGGVPPQTPGKEHYSVLLEFEIAARLVGHKELMERLEADYGAAGWKIYGKVKTSVVGKTFEDKYPNLAWNTLLMSPDILSSMGEGVPRN